VVTTGVSPWAGTKTESKVVFGSSLSEPCGLTLALSRAWKLKRSVSCKPSPASVL